MEKEKGRNTDFETGSFTAGQIAAVLSGDSDVLRSSPVVKENHGKGWRRSDKLRFTSSETFVTDQAYGGFRGRARMLAGQLGIVECHSDSLHEYKQKWL